MKKKTVLATILCTLFAVAGCGNAAQADADANVNTAADVQVEADSPVADEPDDSELESQPLAEGDIAALMGTWYEDGALDSRTLTIDEDGAFTLEYAGGGALYGTIEITTEVMPDDTESYWYTFYDQEGEIWEAVCIPDEGVQDDLYFGQGGDPHFIRADAVSYPVSLGVLAEDYVGLWQCDRCSINITEGADGFLCEVNWSQSASETERWTYYCDYDDTLQLLACYDGGVNESLFYEETGNEEVIEYYSDGSASFVINEDGYLIWFDDVEGYGDGMEFVKIG